MLTYRTKIISLQLTQVVESLLNNSEGREPIHHDDCSDHQASAGVFCESEKLAYKGVKWNFPTYLIQTCV